MKYLSKLLVWIGLLACLNALADTAHIGVVLMHGKGGSPNKFVLPLASALQARGFQVANLEMPWSGRRDYDVDVEAASAEILAAADGLRSKGASKVFIAGHSQGGIFALYYAGKYPVDGVVAIAPGGNVANSVFRDKLGDSLQLARKKVAQGSGAEKTLLSDFEGSRGLYPVQTTPVNYVAWFDPDGAMNQELALKSIKANTPVLYIAPKSDYPALVRVNGQMFDLLAKHPLTQLYEPATSHVNAPAASAQAIGDWILGVVKD